MAIEIHSEDRFESPQVRTRPVLIAVVASLLLLGLAIGMLDAFYYWQVPVQSFRAPREFPQPRIETGERQQRLKLDAEQASRLNGYRWIDRSKGLVQIPIDRAMQILASEGEKAYAPLAPPQALAAPGAGAERLTTPQAAPPSMPAQNDAAGPAPPGGMSATTPSSPAPAADGSKP